jgi:hypothetical protein
MDVADANLAQELQLGLLRIAGDAFHANGALLCAVSLQLDQRKRSPHTAAQSASACKVTDMIGLSKPELKGALPHPRTLGAAGVPDLDRMGILLSDDLGA